MRSAAKPGPVRLLLTTLLVFVVVTALFYGLNHLVMALQGLPLDLDLSPRGL